MVAAVVSGTNIQFSAHVQELHALEWTGQETVTQIKACGGSLEGNTLENQAVLPAGMPMELTLGQCGAETLTTLEVAGHMLGGKVRGSPACAGKVRGQTSKAAKRDKEHWPGRGALHSTIRALQCCAHLWQEGPQCQFLSLL